MRVQIPRLVRLALLLACLSCFTFQALHAQAPAPVAPKTTVPALAVTVGNMKLLEAATEWKAHVAYDPLTGTGHILRGKDLVRFKLGYPVYSVGPGHALPAPAVIEGPGGLELPQKAYELIGRWFVDMDEDRASRFTVAAILIDPGHGGKDPGAVGEFGSGKDRFKLYEKDVVLSIGLDVYERLSGEWPGKTIMITRKDDSFPTLEERVEMANGIKLGVNEAIIYVSIHANASFNKNAAGFEVWYLNPDYRRTVVDATKAAGIDKDVLPILNTMLEEEYTTESIFLARSILNGMAVTVGDRSPNRGIRAEEWFVVRNARMPSVLVEVGFITNEAEARLLADPAYLRKLGDGIYNGIVSFVDYFENRKGPSRP
jgi:N-acetylmuramoyl-L-alanine amidase